MASIPINKPFELQVGSADLKRGVSLSGISDVLLASAVGMALIKRASGPKDKAITSWSQYLEQAQVNDTKAYHVSRTFKPTSAMEQALEANPSVLALLRTSPMVSIAQCRECLCWIAVSGATPAKCMIGPGCTGAMAKTPALSAAAYLSGGATH